MQNKIWGLVLAQILGVRCEVKLVVWSCSDLAQLLNCPVLFSMLQMDLFLCFMCRKKFNDAEKVPKTLQCGHTYCLACLRNRRPMTCPRFECNKVSPLSRSRQGFIGNPGPWHRSQQYETVRTVRTCHLNLIVTYWNLPQRFKYRLNMWR